MTTPPKRRRSRFKRPQSPIFGGYDHSATTLAAFVAPSFPNEQQQEKPRKELTHEEKMERKRVYARQWYAKNTAKGRVQSG